MGRGGDRGLTRRLSKDLHEGIKFKVDKREMEVEVKKGGERGDEDCWFVEQEIV